MPQNKLLRKSLVLFHLQVGLLPDLCHLLAHISLKELKKVALLVVKEALNFQLTILTKFLQAP